MKFVLAIIAILTLSTSAFASKHSKINLFENDFASFEVEAEDFQPEGNIELELIVALNLIAIDEEIFVIQRLKTVSNKIENQTIRPSLNRVYLPHAPPVLA